MGHCHYFRQKFQYGVTFQLFISMLLPERTANENMYHILAGYESVNKAILS